MRPTTSLQLSAFAFTIFWFGGMLWVSGTDDLGVVATLLVCNSVAGLVWYRLMHWSFRHMSLLPIDGVNAG